MTRPLRVLHWITGLRTGGAEMMLLKLLASWDPKDLECRVVSLTDLGTLGPRMEALGVPVRALGLPRGGLTSRGLLNYLRVATSDWHPDLHQGWMLHGNLAATVAARLTGGVALWNIRNALDDLIRETERVRFMVRACRVLSGHPTRIICNSSVSQRQHQAIGFRGTWSIIPNGFDLDRFRPDAHTREALRAEWGVPPRVPLVLHLSRFHGVKDQRGLLAGLALVARTGKAFQLVLAGHALDPSNRELMAWIRSEALTSRCRLLGERADAERILAASDLLISSISEAFPNVIGEALACGIPVVATDVGDSAFLVGEAGRVVPARDPEALAAAVSALLEDPAERQRLGALGRARMARDFTLTAVANRYLDLYRTLRGA